jgi:hypothetical protein
MNSLRAVSIVGIAAVLTNVMLMAAIGIEFEGYRALFRAVVIALLLPGLFSDAKFSDVIKNSRIIKAVFRIR